MGIGCAADAIALGSSKVDLVAVEEGAEAGRGGSNVEEKTRCDKCPVISVSRRSVLLDMSVTVTLELVEGGARRGLL